MAPAAVVSALMIKEYGTEVFIIETTAIVQHMIVKGFLRDIRLVKVIRGIMAQSAVVAT
jgi:hypothetical protein